MIFIIEPASGFRDTILSLIPICAVLEWGYPWLNNFGVFETAKKQKTIGLAKTAKRFNINTPKYNRSRAKVLFGDETKSGKQNAGGVQLKKIEKAPSSRRRLFRLTLNFF